MAVSNLPLALKLVGGTPEPVPNFADVQLIETGEAGFYFDNEMDEKDIRWASPLQTWLELNAGDARQQEAGRDLRKQVAAMKTIETDELWPHFSPLWTDLRKISPVIH